MANTAIKEEICIVSAGSADAGKSTLLSVLLYGELDDGNGKARNKIAKHQHEIDKKKTSDITIKHMELNDHKDLILVDVCGQKKYLKSTARALSGQMPDFAMLVIAANRGVVEMTAEHLQFIIHSDIPFMIVLTREDIAPLNEIKQIGKRLHRDIEKTYKRKLMTINPPKISFIRKKIPAIMDEIEEKYADDVKSGKIDLTKIKHGFDAISKTYRYTDLKSNLDEYTFSIVDSIIDRLVSNQEEVDSHAMIDVALSLINTNNTVPVIVVSNKTGYYINVLKTLLSHLKSKKQWEDNDPMGSRFYVDDSFKPKGVGLVASGILRGPNIKVDDELFIGPHNKKFVQIKVKSIHNNMRQNIDQLINTRRGCLAIKCKEGELARKDIKKGMIIVSNKEQVNNVCFEFTAQIQVLHHPTTISTNRFTSQIHCGLVRQTGRLTVISKKSDDGKTWVANEELKPGDEEEDGKKIKKEQNRVTLKTGDVALVKFRFIKSPEYIEPGSKLFFRGGTTIGTGKVLEVLPISKDPKGAEIHRYRRGKHRGNRKRRNVNKVKKNLV